MCVCQLACVFIYSYYTRVSYLRGVIPHYGSATYVQIERLLEVVDAVAVPQFVERARRVSQLPLHVHHAAEPRVRRHGDRHIGSRALHLGCQ